MSESLIMLGNDRVPYSPGRLFNIPRVTRGLRGQWDLGGDLALSRLRRAPYVTPPVSAAQVGTPTANPNNVLFDGLDHFFDTGLPEEASMTLAWGGWSTDTISGAASTPVYAGNFQSSATDGRGIGIYVTDATPGYPSVRVTLVASYLDTDGTTVLNRGISAMTIANIATPAFWVAVVEAGVGLTLYNMTTGQSATFAETRARLVRPRNIRMGSGYSGNGGKCNLTTFFVYGTALTAAERAALYASVKVRASALSPAITL